MLLVNFMLPTLGILPMYGHAHIRLNLYSSSTCGLCAARDHEEIQDVNSTEVQEEPLEHIVPLFVLRAMLARSRTARLVVNGCLVWQSVRFVMKRCIQLSLPLLDMVCHVRIGDGHHLWRS